MTEQILSFDHSKSGFWSNHSTTTLTYQKGLCTKDVHPMGGRGGFKIVDENGHGGRGGSGRMDVHFSGPSKVKLYPKSM